MATAEKVSSERLALAEARAFISTVVENGGYIDPNAARAFERWLVENPFDPPAAMAVLRRNLTPTDREEGGTDA